MTNQGNSCHKTPCGPDTGAWAQDQPLSQPVNQPVKPRGRLVILLRWGLLIAGFLAFNYAASRGLTSLIEPRLTNGLDQGALIALAALLLYAGLLAIPFVPGVEIGLLLLVMHGAAVAPFVHGATVVGLTISYLVGSAFETSLPCTFLRKLGLLRACAFLDRMKDMDQSERLAVLEANAPPWLGQSFIRHRYLLLGILLNLPGTSLIGGGGGIALVAGLSRLFSFPAFILTIVIATAPIPLAVYLYGTDFLQ